MPHLTIDYSPNMEDLTDMPGLCDALRRAAIETGVFPMAGVRVRAFRADHVSIADGDPGHGYIDISVRLRGGRSLDTRRQAAQAIFDAARAHLAPVLERHSLALSLEMRDIDPDLSPKVSTCREHMDRSA